MKYNEQQIKFMVYESIKKNVCTTERLESLSNYVYLCTLEDREKIVLKINNKNSENLFTFNKLDAQEIIISSGYFKDIVIVQNNDFVIEKYIDGCLLNNLEFRDRTMRLNIINSIVNFHLVHSLKLPQENLLVQMRNKLLKSIVRKLENLEKIESRKKAESAGIEMIKFMNEILADDNRGGPIVFSHNDLLQGNILVGKTNITFIDFEYSGPCFYLNDVYNILIESTYLYETTLLQGYKQYVDNFPDDETVKEFIGFYLFLKDNPYFVSKNIRDSNELKKIEDKSKEMVSEAILNESFKHFWFCGILVNIFWAFWSLTYKKDSDKNFDYFSYGLNRFQDFKNCKRKYESLLE